MDSLYFLPPFSSCPWHGTTSHKDVPFALLIYSPEENKRRTEQIMKVDFLSHTKQTGTVTQPMCLNSKAIAFWWRSGIRWGKENIQVLSLSKESGRDGSPQTAASYTRKVRALRGGSRCSRCQRVALVLLLHRCKPALMLPQSDKQHEGIFRPQSEA